MGLLGLFSKFFILITLGDEIFSLIKYLFNHKIGLEKSLSKPVLRKEVYILLKLKTEMFMREISDGTKPKLMAINEIILQYKSIFAKIYDMHNCIIDVKSFNP